jgi:hypothetical protein
LATCLTIPSLIFGIMTKNDRERVRLFNRSWLSNYRQKKWKRTITKKI